MTRPLHIDREKEIAFFEAVLAGQTEGRILLVEGESSWGKSILLREFIRCKPKDFHFADIDFKAGGTSLTEFLSRICDKLGQERFPCLREELHNISHGPFNIMRNLMVGRNRISLFVPQRDEQENQARISALTDTFFSDVRKIGKAIIILDTFEKANENIQKWLTDAFLPRVQLSPNLYVVIGGQRIPELSMEWQCEHILLGGISHEYWYQYAVSLGVSVDIEYIRGICDFTKGNPYAMKNYIDGFIVQRRTP